MKRIGKIILERPLAIPGNVGAGKRDVFCKNKIIRHLTVRGLLLGILGVTSVAACGQEPGLSAEDQVLAQKIAADADPDWYQQGKGSASEFISNQFYTLRSVRWAVRDRRTCDGVSYPAAVKRLANFYREFQKGQAWQEKPRLIALPRLNAPPTLDGRLDPEEWQGAAVFSGEFPVGTAEPDRNYPDSRWYVGVYRDALYIGARFRDRDRRVLSGTSFDEPDPIYQGDSLEVFVRPDTDQLHYREFLVNPDGKCWALLHKASPFGQWDMLDARVDSGMETKTLTGPEEICFEVKIPLRFGLGTHWSLMLVRGNRDGGRECRYSTPVPLLYHTHNIYGYIVVD